MAFEKALIYVLSNEGGFSDISMDRGGPTQSGISMHTYSSYVHRPVTIQEMKDLSPDQVASFYKDVYWDAHHLDKIYDEGIQSALLDVCVNLNNGTSWGIILAQRICGVVVDGILGEDSIKAINIQNPKQFLIELMSKLQEYYVDIVIRTPSQIAFLKGWLARSRRILELI